MKVCVVGASGKLGRYMLRHALECGHEVVGVCREQSVDKLAEFEGRITVVPGPTDAAVIKKAVAGCDGVLVVLVPRGMHHYCLEPRRLCSTTRSRTRGFLLVRLARQPRRSGRLQLPLQGIRQGSRPARSRDTDRRSRRPSGSLPAGLRERHPMDSGARQRPGGRRERGSTGVEPARRRPDPGEQHHPKDRLRPVHGRHARKR
jgi:hypothetical protein